MNNMRIEKLDATGPAKKADESTTEVVYICTPDWQHYLFTSLRSLLASGSSFDRVVICCVGKRPSAWVFEDPRILVEEVTPLIDGYFFSNKTYLCRRSAERVIYLDADTMILRPIDALYLNVDSDFIGRAASGYQDANWEQAKWFETLALVGADETPYFNAGFVVFQNGAHRRLNDLWLEFTRRNLAGDLMKLRTPKFAEQFALSLAVGAARLSYHMLDRKGHAFGWVDEPFEDTVVFHAGSPGFMHIATTIETTLGIGELDLPAFKRSSGLSGVKLQRKLRTLRARLKGLVGALMPWIARRRGW